MRSARSKGLVDEDYKAFIGGLACVVCMIQEEGKPVPRGKRRGYSQVTRTEVAHVGVRGLSQKCSDREAIPLCIFHHEHGYPESHHTLGKKFWEHHGIDRDVLVKFYNDLYERK